MRPDGVFGHINNKAKHTDVELPEDYLQVIAEAGSVGDFMQQDEFINYVTMFRGLFTYRKTDVVGTALVNITTYAWYRFSKTDAGEVVMLVKKTTEIIDPWIVVAIEKRKGAQHIPITDCRKAYGIEYEDNTFEYERRDIKLAKQWDLYDLAQEFMSERAKAFYTQPARPRPKPGEDDVELVDDDADDESDDDMHDMFDE